MGPKELEYLSGFGNEFSSEALPGALPVGQNSPKEVPYGLYAEQLSGTAFTAPRRENLRSWLYRIKPSVGHGRLAPVDEDGPERLTADFSHCVATPEQLRWNAVPIPEKATNFVQGLQTVCGAGSAATKDGYAIHWYTATTDMEDCCLSNADGDFLIVPQLGSLRILTEFGRLLAKPEEIVVVPRGMRFSVFLPDKTARGYVLEVFSGHFRLPDLGPIGANGLANLRDFQAPVAWYEERDCDYKLLTKFEGRLFSAGQDHSPYNVVAWHGNYVPYKYDLKKFCPMNAVAFDHADPSIFTVLTCPSAIPGVAIADFVIFPSRWNVAEHTFRLPYFHRNVMSEFMGLIRGEYDAKAEGFAPGGSSLHSCMSAHGPDVASCTAAIHAPEEPRHLPRDTMAFMFETYYTPRLTAHALDAEFRQADYYYCWQGFKSTFTGPPAAQGNDSGWAVKSLSP